MVACRRGYVVTVFQPKERVVGWMLVVVLLAGVSGCKDQHQLGLEQAHGKDRGGVDARVAVESHAHPRHRARVRGRRRTCAPSWRPRRTFCTVPGPRLRVDKSFRLDGERGVMSRTPLLHGGRLFEIFLYDRKDWTESRLMCFDSQTLELQWERVEAQALGNVVVNVDGDLLLLTMTGPVQVICLDPAAGAPTWTWRREDEGAGMLSDDADGRVLVTGVAEERTTWCLDSRTGAELWSFSNGDHPYTPSVHEGRLFLSTKRTLNALDMASGLLLWSSSEPTTYLFTPVVVAGLVVISGHGLINAYDSDDGELRAQLTTGQPRDAVYGVAVAEDTVCFGDSAGFVYCWTVTAGPEAGLAERWRYASAGAVSGTPAVVNDRLYVANGAKKLLALDMGTGELLAQVGIRAAPREAGVVVDEDGNLYVAAERNLLKVVAV